MWVSVFFIFFFSFLESKLNEAKWHWDKEERGEMRVSLLERLTEWNSR